MGKIFLACVVFLAACSCTPVHKDRVRLKAPKTTQEYETETIRRMALSAVRIVLDCGADGEPDGYGSGTAVSHRTVLTARHVYDGCDPGNNAYFAITSDGRTLALHRDGAATLPQVDAARFALDPMAEPFWTYSPVANYQPRVGQPVYFYTGDGTTEFVFKAGHVAVTDYAEVTISVHGVPGNSGSAVFDAEGNVIAILWGGRWHPAGENLIKAFRPTVWPDLLRDLK